MCVPRPGANVQCLPVRKTAGWKATDIAGYRSGGARLHYRLIGVIWRFADKSAKWMRKRCGVTGDALDQPILADLPGVRTYVSPLGCAAMCYKARAR